MLRRVLLKKMDFFVEKKLEEWNLTCLKETFEGKNDIFHLFFIGLTLVSVIFCRVNSLLFGLY